MTLKCNKNGTDFPMSTFGSIVLTLVSRHWEFVAEKTMFLKIR